MSKRSISFGRVLLQIALGLMLLVGGIWAFIGGGDAGAEAVKSVFKGDLAVLLKIVYGIIELIAGFFLILDLFVGDKLGTFGTVLMVILIIVWIAVIVIADFFNISFSSVNYVLKWIYQFASHLIVLGALVYLRF